MVRADLFSGSLTVWNVRGGAALIFRPPDPSPPQAGEDRIPFELFQEYTALRGKNKYNREFSAYAKASADCS